jgi:hypothetical protein
MVLMDAATKMPVAGNVVPIQEHAGLSMRALVTQAQTNRAAQARWPKVVFDRGFWDGAVLWWLAQHRIVLVGPAQDNMAVTIDAQAHAAVGEGVTIGGRVHVLFTWLMFALATAYRRQCEQEDTGGELVGWQRWRRQLLEQTRDRVIIVAADAYGIVHVAEYSLVLGVKLKDVPPGLGTYQEILAKYRLLGHG